MPKSIWSVYYNTRLKQWLYMMGFRATDFRRWSMQAEHRILVNRPTMFDHTIVRLFK